MSLILNDELKKIKIIAAPQRSKRPHAHSHIGCPFDPLNEQMTPPATMEVATFENPKTNWRVRVFENKFPALTLREKFEKNKNITGAYGSQEVIVETSIHEEQFENFTDGQLSLVFDTYVNRFKHMSALLKVEYVFLGKNHGKEAGASIAHEHSQIFALPFVPDVVKSEFAPKQCAFCKLLKKNTKKSIVFQNAKFAVVRPDVARFQLECWIIPKKHVAGFTDFSSATGLTFMKTLRETIRRVKKHTENYNVAFHPSAKNVDGHFHVEVYPLTEHLAMLELGANVFINSMDAKTALKKLK